VRKTVHRQTARHEKYHGVACAGIYQTIMTGRNDGSGVTRHRQRMAAARRATPSQHRVGINL